MKLIGIAYQRRDLGYGHISGTQKLTGFMNAVCD